MAPVPPRIPSISSGAAPGAGPAGAKPGRLPGVDAGRVIAALATVWLHTVANPDEQYASSLADSSALGRFAVPFFCFIAGLFLVSGLRSRPDRPLGAYAAERFFRLYMPFIGWSVIYLLARSGARLAAGNELMAIDFSSLLAGTAQHLWFLPFLLIFSILAFALTKAVLGSRLRETSVGVLLVAGGLAIAWWAPTQETFAAFASGPDLSWDYFLGRTFNRCPSILWGVAVGLMIPGKAGSLRTNWPVCLLGMAVMAACLGYVWMIGHDDPRAPTPENLAGLAWVAVVMGPWTGRAITQVAKLGGLSYGVYLAHVLFVIAIHKVGDRLGVPHEWWSDVLTFIGAAVGSLVTIYLFRKSRYTRWLAP